MIFKLGGHSAEELAFRFGQCTWNLYDRLRLKIGLEKKYYNNVRSTDLGFFFYKQQDIDRIPTIYVQQTKARQLLMQRADTICCHRFDLLGYQNLNFDRIGQVNWHIDPVQDIMIPQCWWQTLLNPATLNGADPKIVWELNRHQHLVTLAQSYVVTKEERYRAELISQLRSWLDANSPKNGINWASSLELAYRSIAWLWAWFLCGSGEVFGALTERFITMLGMHAEHIEHNLSVYFSPNTHLSGEALGLYYIGTLLPNLKGAERWRRIGRHWLMACLRDHVLPDGGYMERTPWYHRYTLDIYLHFYLLGLQNDDSTVESLEPHLQKLGYFLAYSLQPDSKLPHLGDDDGGRLLPLDGLLGDDPSGIFNILAVLFQSGEFASLSDTFSEEALWLLGPTGASVFLQIAPQRPFETSKIFPETGYAFLRSGWGGEDVYVSFDCGRHGWLNHGHAHADMLSLQVYSGRNPVIKDPGTCSYLNPWRDWFRNAESHAVVRVDNKFPAVTAGLFQWSTVPNLIELQHRLDDRVDYVAGIMDAVTWQHSREIFFLKPTLIMLLDTIEGKGTHEIELRFPLADIDWIIARNSCTSTRSERVCTIKCETDQPHQVELIKGWQSTCYGQREAALILVFKGILKTPQTIATLIDLSGVDHCIQRSERNGREAFVIETFHGGRTVVTVESSLKEGVICAAFAE